VKKRVFVVLAAACALLITVTPAAADPNDDKARVDQQVAEARAALEAAGDKVEAAAAAFEEANARLPGVQKKLADAQGVLAGAQAQAKTAATVAEQAANELAAADEALAQATQRVEHTRQEIAVFARSAYTGGTLAQLDALLSAPTPADFVAGLTYVDHVNRHQQAVLDANVAARADQRDKQNTQAQRKRDSDAAKADADAAVRYASATELEAERAAQEVQALVAQRQAALDIAQAEKANSEQRYQELQAESARIEAEIRALAAGGGPVLQPGAKLLMPVNAIRKSSDFGMRFDPVYQRYQLHAGVDFAAAGGAPIWAAAAGQVFKAGWNGGYGNYTCIYHGTYEGKGFATCYAHQSAILVSVGDQVSQGQVIGRVGTTGASTGNHLHFEVRLDGTPVDPLPWLPACLC
jgi:murein DD-endopeptidase MepM/ murein hydrolase activator NlpD